MGLLDWPLLGGLLRPSLSISTLGSLKLQGHTKYLTSVSAQDWPAKHFYIGIQVSMACFKKTTGPEHPLPGRHCSLHCMAKGVPSELLARVPQSAAWAPRQPPHLYRAGSSCGGLHGSRGRRGGPSRAGRADRSQHAGLVLLADAGGLQVLAQHLQVARESVLRGLLPAWGCRGSRGPLLLLLVQQGVLLLLPHRLLPDGRLPTGVSAIALHPAGAPTCRQHGSRLAQCAGEQSNMIRQATKEQQVQNTSWGAPTADNAGTHVTQMWSSSRAMSQSRRTTGKPAVQSAGAGLAPTLLPQGAVACMLEPGWRRTQVLFIALTCRRTCRCALERHAQAHLTAAPEGCHSAPCEAACPQTLRRAAAAQCAAACGAGHRPGLRQT